MRLIDADLLVEKLNVFNDRENGNEHFLFGIETAKELLEDMPTAYDVEKVVELLEKAQEDFGSETNCRDCKFKNICDEGYYGCVETMLEIHRRIVKAGGIDAD